MEMEKVVEEARMSFRAGVTRPLQWRRHQLDKILLMLNNERALIEDALFRDMGKSAFQSYLTEISIVQRSCTLARKKLKKWAKPAKVGANLLAFPSWPSIVPDPLGLILIIGTWNFPFLLIMDPLVGAISAGNAVVLKPSEVAPATSDLLLRLIPSYMDSSAIKVMVGDASVASALLEIKWDKILFTGSSKIGKKVMNAAAKHLCPVTLELGGKCPAIVDSTVDLKVTARRIVYGKWGINNGQACISVDYVLVEDSVAESLVELLKKTIEKFYGKEPHNSKDLSKIVNRANLSRLQDLLREPGVIENIVYGGRCAQDELFMDPTLVVNPSLQSSIMEEEIFGPILVIIKVSSMQKAIDFVNDRPKPLAAYVFSNSKSVKETVMKSVVSGAIIFNDTIMHFSVENLPFGGVGDSGMGCYHGKFSFDAFSHHKAVLDRSTKLDLTLRYPPYSPSKTILLSALCKAPSVSFSLVRSILQGFKYQASGSSA